jgi:hypothetical protein
VAGSNTGAATLASLVDKVKEELGAAMKDTSKLRVDTFMADKKI